MNTEFQTCEQGLAVSRQHTASYDRPYFTLEEGRDSFTRNMNNCLHAIPDQEHTREYYLGRVQGYKEWLECN